MRRKREPDLVKVGMKNSLTKVFSQREMDEHERKMIRSYRGLANEVGDAWRNPAADAEKDSDNLKTLISDTELLLVEFGYEVPQSGEDKSDAEKRYMAHVRGMLKRNPEIEHWSPEELANFTCAMVTATQDPQSRLYGAYKSFKAAEAMYTNGDLAEAVKVVASGAMMLVQGVTAVYSMQRRAGGLKKTAENETAKAKARAIRESQLLWLEREDGKHPKLRTEDQFAMEVARRWPIISSISAIKKRSAEWRRASAELRRADS
jgi:hypothetical protein